MVGWKIRDDLAAFFRHHDFLFDAYGAGAVFGAFQHATANTMPSFSTVFWPCNLLVKIGRSHMLKASLPSFSNARHPAARAGS
jgi:hypothetical protein